MNCQNCQSTIENGFNFCPNCAFKLEDENESTNQFVLSSTKLSKLFGAIENPTPLTIRSKSRLRRMGNDLGYDVFVDYYNPKLPYSEKQKPIDVVWKSDGRIVIAFQVRAKRSDFNLITSKHDLESLQKLDTEEKFIVYVSSMTGKAYFNRIDEDTILQKRRTINVPDNIEEIRKNIPRAYEMWTSKEEEDLIKEFQSGKNPYELAKMHRRGTGAIFSRLKKLGLIQD